MYPKNKKTLRPCPICSGTSNQVLRHFSFILPEGHPLSEGYDLVSCTNCGFIYANTAVSMKDYDLFYKNYSKYEDNSTSTGGGETQWDLTRLNDNAKFLSAFLPDHEAEILDVGCANGGMLGALQRVGYEHLSGIDPSPACVFHTQQKGFTAQVGTLSSNNFPTHHFDCIIFSHVLEHLLDLEEAVQKIHWLLKDDGVVYIEVPDATRYKDFVFSPFQDINTEHINHFSLTSLNNLFWNWQTIAYGQKEIFSSPAKPYPALFSLYKYRQENCIDRAIQKDEELSFDMQKYLEYSQKLISDLDNRIKSAMASQTGSVKDLIVWGTGQLTMKLLTETCLGEFNVIAFIDGNPINQGKMLNSRKVISPKQAALLPTNVPILISTLLHQQEIAETIKALNLPNPFLSL